ncbi:hypothetical protein QFZ34_000021 [Phyllobacterium ifriqiyense]|uniref:Uncharacterized protein n=1 Tax=Phyllobacterium ifriqiyense TaxID=314238 RepID=A0ABU0S282_9HYPH|nr:hypothetical protein [Phyllobacterium ifriqiyense]
MWVAAGHPHSAYRCPVPNLQNSNPHDFGRHLISHEDWQRLYAWFALRQAHFAGGGLALKPLQRCCAWFDKLTMRKIVSCNDNCDIANLRSCSPQPPSW